MMVKLQVTVHSEYSPNLARGHRLSLGPNMVGPDYETFQLDYGLPAQLDSKHIIPIQPKDFHAVHHQ